MSRSNTPPRKLRAAIFDLDGLMVDSEPLQWQAMNAALGPVGVRISEAEWQQMVGRRTAENLSILKGRYGFANDIAAIERQKDEEYRRLAQANALPMPGLEQAIASCEAAGLRLAVASSSVAVDVHLVLKRIGVDGRFEAVVTGDDVRRGKPDPEIMLLAATRLEVQPQHCIVFEDTPYGISAAKAAGMIAVAIPNRYTAHHSFEHADCVLSSLLEVDLERLSTVGSTDNRLS